MQAIRALLLGLCVLAPAAAIAGEGGWQTLGLMRVRDMTPFGIARLDMLPAHAVAATPGTFAFEANVSYQNTWALSDNVKDYLEARGGPDRLWNSKVVAVFPKCPPKGFGGFTSAAWRLQVL